MGELFASDVKGVASAIAVMFNWTLVFIITKTFGMMKEAWGTGELNLTFCELFISYALFNRANFLFLRGVHGGWHNFRVHQSPGNQRKVKCSDSSHSRWKELKILHREFTQTQHSQNSNHHHTHRTNQIFIAKCFSFCKRFFDVK